MIPGTVISMNELPLRALTDPIYGILCLNRSVIRYDSVVSTKQPYGQETSVQYQAEQMLLMFS